MTEALFELERSLDLSTAPNFQRSMASIGPRLERIAVALDSEFSSPQYLRDIRLKVSAEPARGRAIYLECQRFHRLNGSKEAWKAPEAMILPIRRIAERFEALGYPRGTMSAEMALAGVQESLGRPDLRLAHTRTAVAISRALGEDNLTCHYLGLVGDCHEVLGHGDSVLAAYEEGLALALQRRFPDQAARLMSFISHFHAREGRLMLATQWVERSLRTCRELGGGALELRYIVNAIEHFAELGCWDVVEDYLARCPVVLRELERTTTSEQLLKFRRNLACCEARLTLVRGDLEGARERFLDALAEARKPGAVNNEIDLLMDWTRGLIEAGLMAEALPYIEECLSIVDPIQNIRPGRVMAIRRARVLYALGRTREAAVALTDFDRRVAKLDEVPAEWLVEREVLRARLLSLRGKPDAAKAALLRSLDALRRHARRLDAGPLGYLKLEAMDDVRHAVHEIGGLDPSAGYHFELEWRALARELGAGSRPEHGAWAGRWFDAVAAESTFVPREGTHLVFLVTPTSVVRWTATSAGVERDTLEISAPSCARQVEQAVKSLRQGSAVETRRNVNRGVLRDLAGSLLPRSILSAPNREAPGLLQISADGPLEGLPFEALDRSERGPARPLALDFDVARVRSPAPPWNTLGGGQPVILSNPVATEAVRRRFPGVGPLSATELESRASRRAWSGARVLEGDQARKPAVLESWSRASLIHVAAHMVRDPDLPFSPFIPLPTDAADSLRNDRVEIADVRSLDLSRCGLAVFSTCGSGEPYTPGRHVGPSFGDAFVDAGARSVVQTSWEVDDARAARFVTRFLTEWSRSGGDPVRALGSARRAALRGELGTSSAADWAAWSVSVAGPRRRAAPAGGQLLSARPR